MKLRCICGWPIRSPARLLACVAVAVTVAFLVVHAVGWRSHTAVFSGSIPPGATSQVTAVVGGVVYGACYFSFILLAPILLIASAMSAMLERIIVRRRADRRAR